MKNFKNFLNEDSSVSSVPAADQGKVEDPLKNPSYMHSDYNEAVNAASKMSQDSTDPADRFYVLSYKYAEQEHIKKFVVVYNKNLLSQAPDWEKRNYTIIAWVSPIDGLVQRTQDGNYVKVKQ